MNDEGAYHVEKSGKKTKSTSFRIDIQLHELVTRSGKNWRKLMEGAIIREFGLPSPDNSNDWSDEFREKIRHALEEEARKAENNEKRMEIIKDEIERARAKEIADVLTADKIRRLEKEREETYRRKLTEAFERVMKKHGLTKSRIRRMIPEYDPETNNLDDWLKIEGEIRTEAREWFTDDEIRGYAKDYITS